MSNEKAPVYLAIDPGDMTGWATFDASGDLLDMGQVPELDFNRWLSHALVDTIKVVICENYLNAVYNAKIHISRRNRSNKTSKKIGAVETLCDIKGISVVLQPNTNKPIGYGYAGLEQPKNHAISHQYDAVAHGTYYLVKNNIKDIAKTLKNMIK